MAIQGVITNSGLAGAQLAANNEGFNIVPTSFSVSNVLSALDPSRTTANSGVFYQAPISSRVVVSYNTVKFICTVPPGVIPANQFETIRELYIFGEQNSTEFLFAIGQPNPGIIYDPTGSVTLELDVSLVNIDLSSIITFSFTQATEILEHNTDPNAHPELVDAINKAGLFYTLGGGPVAFDYHGQSFDEKAEFDGTPAFGTRSGVTFTADHNGPDGNSIIIPFNNVLTTDQLKVAWNNANPYNTVSHDGTGSEVLGGGNLALSGGSLNVGDKEPVYRDTDGIYKQAIADGTIKSRVAGFADFMSPSKRFVRSQGFLRKTTGFAIGSKIYLSPTVAGGVTTIPSGIQLGIQTHTDVILCGTGFGSGEGTGDAYDAIVSDIVGVDLYPTTQQAIAATPDGGRILVDKLEVVTTTIDTQGKRIDFFFTGPEAGWSRYLGTSEQQLITFSTIPTSGTWRAEWNGFETADMPYNANAAAVQAAMNAAFSGSGIPVTVSGNYTSGFTVTFQPYFNVGAITFNNPGVNEIQKLAFSATPDDGTFRLNFNGNDTANIAWNDNNALIEFYLESVPGINSVAVTGSMSTSGLFVEFDNTSGKQDQSQFTLVNNTLTKTLNPVSVNITTTQPGKFPANNLKAGINSVGITVQTVVEGTSIGDATAINVTKANTRFVGLGSIVNWPIGIDMGGFTGSEVELYFQNTTRPVQNTGLKPRRDYHRERSFGMLDPVVMWVGPAGDYLDLWEAFSAAADGDKIIVAADQHTSVNRNFNKKVDIEFIQGAKLIVDTFVGGAVLTFGDYVKTKNMYISVSDPGNYSAILRFTGDRGHHTNMQLDFSGGAVNVTNAFELDGACNQLYLDGAIFRGGASVLSVLAISGGFGSNNVFIRDKDLDIVHNTISDTSQGEKVLASEGQTVVNFNVLKFSSSNARWDLTVTRDGITVFQDEAGGFLADYRKNSNTQIEFAYPLLQDEEIVGRVLKNNVVSLGTQAYFVNYVDNQNSAVIPTGNDFNNGTNKLSVYRNGLYMAKSATLGAPGDRYLESGSSNIVLGFGATPVEWFGFINEDNTPTRVQVDNLSGTVLTVPSYLMGSERLRVYRNGILMNRSGIGNLSDQYTETSSTSITLALAANPSEVFTFYVCALTPVYRADYTGLGAALVGIPAYTMGDERLLVFRNGVLIMNTNSLATPSERYQETSPTSITLGTSMTGSETLTVIYK